jgi:hypothetical protein
MPVFEVKLVENGISGKKRFAQKKRLRPLLNLFSVAIILLYT